MNTAYPKKWGFLRNAQVRQHIATLDPIRDCQEIVQLLATYEYPYDTQRALELALFYTYGSQSVSKLLDKTREFANDGQKRYDDTRILIGLFLESGWEGDFGRQAIARINRTHSHYSIYNDDFLFVLWTFIEFPIRWSKQFAYRAMTAHEQKAWFHFWHEVGTRLNIQHIPANKKAFDDWVKHYETREMLPCAANHRVANATAAIMENWLPKPLRPSVKWMVRGLMEEHFLYAIGYPPAPEWFKMLLRPSVKAAFRLGSTVVWHRYPLSVYTEPHPYCQQQIQHVGGIAPSRLRSAEMRSKPISS